MTLDAKSFCAANALQTLFAKRAWHGFLATPTSQADVVCVQYKSEALGEKRVVECKAMALANWMKAHANERGFRAMFEEILDRKPERATPVQQQLFPPDGPPDIVRQSMMGD